MNNHLKSHIGYWINRLRVNIHQGFEQRLSQYQISVAQWCVLVALYDKQASSVGGLSSYIEVDKASISRVVERLVDNELVSHGIGDDNRSGVVKLTAKGKKLVPLLLKEAQSNEELFFGHLTEIEKKQFQFLLHKIFKHITPSNLNELVKLKEKI